MKYEERAQLVALGTVCGWLVDALLDKPELSERERHLISRSAATLRLTTRNLTSLVDKEDGFNMIGSTNDTEQNHR